MDHVLKLENSAYRENMTDRLSPVLERISKTFPKDSIEYEAIQIAAYCLIFVSLSPPSEAEKAICKVRKSFH